jgi:thioredoxin reductase (NADPH)
VPNTDLFKDAITTDENGFVVPQNGTMTNIPGVFVAGDCADHVYRQAITAAGAGCAAAIDAERFLAAENQ